jgi:hypothetical protein
MLRAGKLGDCPFPTFRTPWKKLADTAGEGLDVGRIPFRPALGLALAPARPRRFVGKTRRLRLLECRLLHQKPLPLIALPRSGPLENDRVNAGDLLRAARQGRIARRKKGEMVEIGARETQRSTLAREENPPPTAKLLAALPAHRITV